MNLESISSEGNPVIWERGRRYVRDGRVRSMESDGHGHYQAQVLGTDLYHVTVDMTPDGVILDVECDCPYDGGPLCKHQAAVLLLIREASGVSAPPSHPKSTSSALHDLLAQQPAERLAALLGQLAEESEMLAHRIRLELASPATPAQQVVTESRQLIRASARAAAGPDDFIDYAGVAGAVEGAEIVNNRAAALVEEDDAILAVRLSLLVVQEMAGLLDTADDSDGIIGSLIEESLDRIGEVTDREGQDMSPPDRDGLFRDLLAAARYPELEGWPDWQLSLLGSAADLAIGATLRAEWEAQVEAAGFGADPSSSYAAEGLALIRHSLISRDDGTDAAALFRSQHLHFKAFRDMAIQHALDDGRYGEAITLAEAGEEQDQAWPGLVRHWRMLRYDAAKGSKRLDLQRQIGVELVLDGDVNYYAELKGAYEPSEWPAIYHNVLQQLEARGRLGDIYTHVLIAENETTRLLAYCQRRPYTIETLYRHLMPTFPDEVVQLFQARIQEAAVAASSRSHYQGVCRIIRTLSRAGAREPALAIIRTLMARYPRKPAFRDELLRLERSLS